MTVDGQVTSNVYSINIMVRKDQVILGLCSEYLTSYIIEEDIEADVFYCFSQNILFRSKKLLCWDITHREV